MRQRSDPGLQWKPSPLLYNVSFKQRSYQKELLDRPDIPFADIKKNMEELDFINRHLGGHQITLAGLKKLIPPGKRALHVVEIGCGGGNNLRVVKQWCERTSVQACLTGIDINPECIAFARQQALNRNIDFICSDYSHVQFEQKPDVIFSSLFCHHFEDGDLKRMMQWMDQNSAIGFFINDLHRHPIAYLSIALLTRLFSKSYLVKNDAPLSVKRGFSKKDWQKIFSGTGISHTIEWKWAFRWLVTAKK